MELDYRLFTNMKLNIGAIVTQQHDNMKITAGIANIEEKINLNVNNHVAVMININDYINVQRQEGKNELWKDDSNYKRILSISKNFTRKSIEICKCRNSEVEH